MNRPILLHRAYFILLTAFIFLACSERDEQVEEHSEEAGRKLEFTGKVAFVESEDDTVSVVHVAFAEDNRSRNEGLMNVMNLPEDAGMLFVFENEQSRSFWMANTPLPLDILFVDSDLNIIRIHRNTQPYSQESIRSEGPAQYVVEVNAGYTLEHDIHEGMQIRIDRTVE